MLSGDQAAALALFLRAREAEPVDAPCYERWIARKSLYRIIATTRPDFAELRERLDDLRHFAVENPVPRADLPWLEGNLHFARGNIAEALACYETAWGDHDGSGSVKTLFAKGAALCCLHLGRFAAARDWVNALKSAREAGEHDLWLRELHVRIGLAEAAPTRELLQLLRSLLDHATSVQREDAKHVAHELIVRVRLLDSTEGDPAVPQHPARSELRLRCARTLDAHARYLHRLLVLDFRLACLRYGAAIPSVDDLYYARPQQVPRLLKVNDRADAYRRAQKARASANWTMVCARYVDALLECGWRQREVESRVRRIEEIAGRLP
jgi:tetratricopeptide (TPR) repeat protein